MLTNASMQPYRVFVAEDEAIVSMMLKDVLIESGFVVIGPADTALSALALLEQEPVDCAVPDIKLSDGTSLPVAKALAARGVPFVIETGCDRRRIPAGYNGAPVLIKVFMPEQLIEAIAGLLRPQSFATAGTLRTLAAA